MSRTDERALLLEVKRDPLLSPSRPLPHRLAGDLESGGDRAVAVALSAPQEDVALGGGQDAGRLELVEASPGLRGRDGE